MRSFYDHTRTALAQHRVHHDRRRAVPALATHRGAKYSGFDTEGARGRWCAPYGRCAGGGARLAPQLRGTVFALDVVHT